MLDLHWKEKFVRNSSHFFWNIEKRFENCEPSLKNLRPWCRWKLIDLFVKYEPITEVYCTKILKTQLHRALKLGSSYPNDSPFWESNHFVPKERISKWKVCVSRLKQACKNFNKQQSHTSLLQNYWNWTILLKFTNHDMNDVE